MKLSNSPLYLRLKQFFTHQKTRQSTSSIRVACVGDSITFGAGLENRKEDCYPSRLRELLRDCTSSKSKPFSPQTYSVRNFGVSSSTVQTTGDKPYVKQENYKKSLDFKPDIVLFLLGSNDTKTFNWIGEKHFRHDYEILIDTYRNLESKPQMILLTPPAIFDRLSDCPKNYPVQKDIPPLECLIIKEIANMRKLPVIDLYTYTKTHREWFQPDGLHPNPKGAHQIALLAAKELTSCQVLPDNDQNP